MRDPDPNAYANMDPRLQSRPSHLYHFHLRPMLNDLISHGPFSASQRQVATCTWISRASIYLPLPLLPPLMQLWLMSRELLIATVTWRTRCERCGQAPALFPLQSAPYNIDGPYTTYPQLLGKNHKVKGAAEMKWDAVLKEMDCPPEVLTAEKLEKIAEMAWEVEVAYVEGIVGSKGCGLASWCGYREEVEIV